jgi:hypothetical protein
MYNWEAYNLLNGIEVILKNEVPNQHNNLYKRMCKKITKSADYKKVFSDYLDDGPCDTKNILTEFKSIHGMMDLKIWNV